jgi:hypothetical protein
MGWGWRRASLAATAAVLLSGLFVPQLASAAGSGSFSATGSLATGRFGAAAASLTDGRVLVVGGTPNNATDLKSAEIFDPTTGNFSATTDMGTGREFPAAAPLGDGRVLVAGGLSSGSGTNTAEIYNPATATWTPTTNMGTVRRDAMAATLPDGRVLVAGGLDNGAAFLKSAEIYNPDNNTWTPTTDMGTTRIGAAVSKLPDGRVLVAGGSPSLLVTTNTAEIYNPAAGTWTSTGIGAMTTNRAFTAGALFGDGRALVMGGNPNLNTATFLASAEAFDPATNTFSSTGIGGMATARNAPASAALGDGRVLVAGGSTTGAPTTGLASAEIYSATNTFSFAVQRTQLVVNVQASGKVTVSDASSPATLNAAAAKTKHKKKHKKKKKTPAPISGPLLTASSASGDPPTITVPLSLTTAANTILNQTGSVTVNARITFAPQGGLATTQTAALEIKGTKAPTKHKKHKKKHKKKK